MKQRSREEIRANEAKQILESQLMQEIFVDVRSELFRKMEKTNFFQSKERTELWRMLKTLSNIESRLKRVVDTGKMKLI